MAQRFCLLGHDTDEVGRSSSRNCRECRRLFDRRRRARRRATPQGRRARMFETMRVATVRVQSAIAALNPVLKDLFR